MSSSATPPPSPAPPRRHGRLAGPVLLVAVGLLAAWVWRNHARPAAGLVVDVWVEDEAGRPLAEARVQATFHPGWVGADDAGRARLTGVVLPSGVPPSVDSLPAALQVEAPMHAHRPDRPPRVQSRADGTWEARYVLAAFGTLRLEIAPTRAKEVRAWVEVPGRPHAVEAASGVALARPGQPASWRTFEAGGEVLVCLEGLTGTAARRTWVPAPPLGMARELRLEVETAEPIRGRILVPPGMDPPTRQGLLDVQGIGDAGRPVPYPSVLVGDDGTFEVPYAGAGRYHLTPRLAFVDAPSVPAQGGTEVAIEASHLRPWIVLPVAEWGTRTELAEVRCFALPDETPAHVPQGLATGEDAWRIALPEPGRYRVVVDTRGNDRHAPARGVAEIEATAPGAHVAVVGLTPVPAGEVVVEARPREGHRQGATASLREPSMRTATIFPQIARTASFPNVRAGPVRLEVTWRDPEAAPVFLVGTLEADGVLAFEATAVEGGLLAVTPPESPTGRSPTTATLSWGPGASPHGAAAGEVGLIRLAGTRSLHATARLLPGRYEATLSSDAGATQALAFEIRAGELTTVETTGR